MSSKQDLVASRTASDVERKYNFGKTFAEVFGLAEDARNAAETAQQAADNAIQAVGSLDQDAIFNLLTNNGALKGLFMKDGELYINASYLATGVIKSENGKLVIDLSGVTEPTFNTGISTNGLTVRGDEANAQKLVQIGAKMGNYGRYAGVMEVFSTTGERIFKLDESVNTSTGEQQGAILSLYDQDGEKKVWLYSSDTMDSGIQLFNGNRVAYFIVNNSGNGDLLVADANNAQYARVTATGSYTGMWLNANGATKGSFVADANDSLLTTNKINGKTVSWKDNGDGTYSLIGQ